MLLRTPVMASLLPEFYEVFGFFFMVPVCAGSTRSTEVGAMMQPRGQKGLVKFL